MAQDYHIYIHDNSGNGGTGNKTTPFSVKSEQDSSFSKTAGTAFNIAKGIAKGNGVNMGVSALAKVVPWVAVAVATVKIADKVLTTGYAHQEEYTGNFRNNVNYNNIKTQIHNTFHPIQTWLSVKHQEAQFRKANRAIEQQNRLVGNSILKDMNIGV